MNVSKIVERLKHWLNDVTGIKCNFTTDVIFGYLLKTDLLLPINVIMLITKTCLFFVLL